MRLSLAVLLICLGEGANSQTVWNYNGSSVMLEADGSSRTFTLNAPGPVGTTVLFNGKRSGLTYQGTAYVFSAKCGAVAYSVTGDVSADERTVTLSGQSPILDANCTRTGYLNNVLTFTFKGPAAFPYVIFKDPPAARFCRTRIGTCSLTDPAQLGIDCWCPDSAGNPQSGSTTR